ncbi:sigma-70 family RNA polymerase sigma factor [Desulfobacterota bacterium AH_259_B03_O07]|nr:sigma-70 family RNA polymerase sigma factor [Desulfobacterota bacterium AH_259_B03_O07]
MVDTAKNIDLTDEEAMVEFQNGNAGAFDLLLKRHGSGLLRFIMKMTLNSKSNAEDLFQEVFVKVIEHRKKYDGNKKFTTWLYSLARNHCIDYLRTKKNKQNFSLDVSFSSGGTNGPVTLETLESKERNQEEILIDKEIKFQINLGVGQLKEEFREVFLLREVEFLSLKEIAEITQVPLSTIKSRLRYAYNNLRDVFIKAGFFDLKKKPERGVEKSYGM